MANNHRTWTVPHFRGDKHAEPPTFSERIADFIDSEIDFRLDRPDWHGPRSPIMSSDSTKPWRSGWPEAKR